MTELVLSNGHIAVATLRHPEVLNDLKAKYPADKLLILKLDVTIPQDIEAAFAKTKENFGRLDYVFNNAGAVLTSEVEGTSDEVARDHFELNFWGAVHVTKAAVTFMRDVRTRIWLKPSTTDSDRDKVEPTWRWW
jgi:NAD(P)-dependent dehydrogenase (short-subunit alcohol dehydrogenase family)